MSLLLTICDCETQFVRYLAEYMNQTYQEQIEIMAFDDVQYLLAFLEKKEVDLCVIEEEICNVEFEQLLLTKVERLAFFSKEKEEGKIYKYQAADMVAKDLFRLCEMLELPIKSIRNPFNEDSCRLISFYSPSPYLDQSLVALSFGMKLAENHKVLYLCFDAFSGLTSFFDQRFDQTLLDLLFFLGEKNTRFDLRLQAAVHELDKLHFIPPPSSYFDLKEVKEETWIKLLHDIVKQSNYEYLILDLTDQVRGVFPMLEHSSAIYLCQHEQGMSAIKTNDFFTFLEYVNKVNLRKRIISYDGAVFTELPLKATFLHHSNCKDLVMELIKEYDRIGI